MPALPSAFSSGCHRNIAALGAASLAMGISSSMIHRVLPLFLTTVLAASPLVLGVIEGVAEGSSSIMKIFSGALSDWMRRRKVLVLIGYAISACVKPLFALADTAAIVLVARLADRIGKGIRDAPRDALIADLTVTGQRGAGFGLRHSLFTIGAVVGPLAAMSLMSASGDGFRLVFVAATIPALISVFVLARFVEENPADRGDGLRRTFRREDLLSLPAIFWWTVSFAVLLTMARFSPAFLLLKAHALALDIDLIPMVWVLVYSVYGATAYPFGRLSDHVRPTLQLALGIACLAAAQTLLAYADSLELFAAGIVLWGLQMGILQGLVSVLIANTAPANLRGTAFGIFELAVGVATLAANAGAGLLWTASGPSASFALGGALAVICGGTLLLRLR